MCFYIYLRTNSDLCHLQHKLIGFYDRDEKCLQRGTDWVLKWSSLPPRSNGKPEAATAVVELLMMGMRMPETCWPVFKRQVINLRNCCIWLADSVEIRECIQPCGQDGWHFTSLHTSMPGDTPWDNYRGWNVACSLPALYLHPFCSTATCRR